MFRNWVFKIAAIVILFIGVTFVMRNFVTETKSATNGKKTTFTLPDNSEVILNSDSEIDYKKWNWSENRNLFLKGEAFFKVAKGKRFEVTTPLGKVTVLGTQFDVKVRKNRFDVTCFTGKVKVNYKHKEIILTPGKSVTFDNELQINSIVAHTKPDWLDNKIAFKKESLKYLIDEIQRQYDVNIEIRTNHPDELFTGKIPTDNLDIALEIIATAYHFKTMKVTSNKIIFEEK
ncbi:FecR family protein [Flavobacterium myungsuense]|uniref:FecR family protein n=1 Tax=Flavobacterium myungsuense TaxID=651823 RepID=UPI00362FB6CA